MIKDNLKVAALVVGGSVVSSLITGVLLMKANTETYEMIQENKKLCEEVRAEIEDHKEAIKESSNYLDKNLSDMKETMECLDETFKITNEAFRSVAKQCEELNSEVKSVYKDKADEISKYLSDMIKQEGIDVVESVKKTLRQMEKETVQKKGKKNKTEQA